MSQRQTKLATSEPTAPSEAREQAAAYDSVFAPHVLHLDGGKTIEIPPHPNLRMLDDDRQQEYEELLFETESYDRGPDVYLPAQTVQDKHGNEMILPAETTPGQLLQPYRKTVGEVTTLIRPPHSVRVVQVVLGDELYAQLRAGTIEGRRASSADVWRIWNGQGLELNRRQASDPKSVRGAVDLAAVPEADSK